ncbi:MAG TPA: TolC family protein, partial [Candidatus Elarobacter sp.]|nr:TolC family protein [Candidatus Elarobacter sp.]
MSRPIALALCASIAAASFAAGSPAFAQTAPAPPPAQATPVPMQPAPTAAPAQPSSNPAPQATFAPAQPTVAPQSAGSPAPVPQSTPGAQGTPGTQPVPGSQPSPGAQTTPAGAPQPLTPGGTTPTTTQPAGSTPTGTNPNGTSTPGGATSGTPTGPAGTPGAPGGNIRGGANPPPPIPAVLPPVPSLPPFSVPVNAIPNPDLVGVNQQPFVGLALQDAVVMALQRNTLLAVAQSNQRIANYQIIAAKGAYDVNFQLVPSYSHAVAPVVTAFNTNSQGGPVTTDTANATAGIRGLTQQGGTYSANLVATRVSSDSAFNSYNPFYETALQLAINQPLLRGRAIDQPRLQVQLAQINSTVASSNALADASNTIVQVQDAYFDLVSAWQNVAIQEEGLRNANAQAQSNARLAARGVVAPTDIVEANTQVNVFQDNVYAAIQNVQRVQTQLKQLLLSNPG